MASESGPTAKPVLVVASTVREVLVNPLPDNDGRPRQVVHSDDYSHEISYTLGLYSCTYIFLGGEQDGKEWLASVNALKAGIARVNAERVAANHVGRVDADDYGPWMADVHAFKDRWGVSAVPHDVCVSMNGVETALGLPLTSFGHVGVFP